MDKRLEYLFGKHTDNTLTAAEYMELMSKIDSEKYNDDVEKLADQLWEQDNTVMELPQAKAHQIFNTIINTNAETKVHKLSFFSANKLRLAAAAVALIFASTALIFYYLKKEQVPVTMLQAKATNQHKLIKLADGSTVVLNSNSFLKYQTVFNQDKREVTLVGEGYFDIKHDARHPFIVHAGKLITTVLGTAFNIKAYDNDKNITVTVTRGKVSVSNQNKVLGIITPNQQIAFNKTAEVAVQTLVNSSESVRWQSKDIFFDDTIMQDAVAELEQRFNVKITFTNEAVKKCRFSGTFLNGEKLNDILKVICDFNNATYKITTDGQIIIDGPGC